MKIKKSLSAYDEIAIIEMILDSPSMFLHEIQAALLHITGTNVSTATICKFLHCQGFSRKKLRFTAQQRSDELRLQLLSGISLFQPHMFIFVDETGTDKRSTLRKFGYSFKGTRAITEKQLIRGKQYSAIAAMCVDGTVNVHITTESVNGDIFCDFIERYLQQQLFDGTNPKSVVILDNAAIHHAHPAIELIDAALAEFLPPYSPDYMPIEECFSKVKSFLRSCDPVIQIQNESEI